MNRSLPAFLTLVTLSAVPAPLRAASSDWHHVEGGAIRLVASAVRADDGSLRAALEIRLNPGWKTYWQDPGASGVPPMVAATRDGQQIPVVLGFPEPQWFTDDYGRWAGYDRSVTLAVTLDTPENPPDAARMETNVFLGICETICIPVDARLVLDHDLTMASFADERIVASAFDALPAPAQADLQARISAVDPKALTVEAVLAAGTQVREIFVAGTEMATLGTPRLKADADKPTYVIPLRGSIKSGDVFDYTLVTTGGTVSGQLQIP